MRDCMKEMNQWCGELMQDGVMGEEEEEDKGTRGNTANAVKVYIMVISAAKKIV